MKDKKGHTLYIVGGEIGGVGKSTVGKLLVEYFLEVKKDFWLVDADESKPDVGLAYKKDLYEYFQGKKQIVLSDKDKLFDRQITFSGNVNKLYLLDQVWALAEVKDVLLILPSQVEQYVDNWLKINDFQSFAQQNEPIFLKYWFVCNGTKPSIEMFEKHLEKHDQLSHVFVENRGTDNGVDWDYFDRSGAIKKVREKHRCHRFQVDRLILSPETWELLNKDRLTFKDASTKQNSIIKKAEQNRIIKWLENSKSEIEQALNEFPVEAKTNG
jgi:hypothetical protein